jgi:hypothetical protein
LMTYSAGSQATYLFYFHNAPPYIFTSVYYPSGFPFAFALRIPDMLTVWP